MPSTPQQPEYLNNLVEQNPFNVKYIKAEARRALKVLKLTLAKEQKFERIIAEYKHEQERLKREIAQHVGMFVDLEKTRLKPVLDDTVVKVFDQCAQEELLDADFLQREVYDDTSFHVDFEMLEIFKRIRASRERKSQEYAIISPDVPAGKLTNQFEYGVYHTFVITEDGSRIGRVIGVVSRDMIGQENVHLPVSKSERLVSVNEPLSVDAVHSLMFQNKLAHYPLIDLDNRLVDVISFAEMELIIKKRTRQSMQALDTSRQIDAIMAPESRPVKSRSPRKIEQI